MVVLEGALRSRSLSGPSRLLRAGESSGCRAMWEGGRNEATVVVDSGPPDQGHLTAGSASDLARSGDGSGSPRFHLTGAEGQQKMLPSRRLPEALWAEAPGARC